MTVHDKIMHNVTTDFLRLSLPTITFEISSTQKYFSLYVHVAIGGTNSLVFRMLISVPVSILLLRPLYIGCLCSYSNTDKRLDPVLSDGDLGKIADSMSEWKGSIAEQLELTTADIEAIQVEEPRKLKLQT